MQLTFNELSLSKEVYRKQEVNCIVSEFLKTYSALQTAYPGFARTVCTPIDLNSIELVPGYYIAEWRNSKEVDRDDVRRFLSICQRQNLTTPNYNDNMLVECQGNTGDGIQIAFEQDFPIISFAFSDIWKNSKISCKMHDLEKDEENTIELINFFNSARILENLEWMKLRLEKGLDAIKTPTDFFANYKSLYPSLCFHDNALKQMENQVNPVNIPTIVERLMILEQYFSTWDGGKFERDAFPNRLISPESTKTLTDYEAQHTYEWNGKDILVSYHIRYTGGDIPGRIYFYPDSSTKKAIVCSLNSKLPTVSDPKFKK